LFELVLGGRGCFNLFCGEVCTILLLLQAFQFFFLLHAFLFLEFGVVEVVDAFGTQVVEHECADGEDEDVAHEVFAYFGLEEVQMQFAGQSVLLEDVDQRAHQL
jgi:hypothetical protein